MRSEWVFDLATKDHKEHRVGKLGWKRDGDGSTLGGRSSVGDGEGAVVGFEDFGDHAEADAHAAFLFTEEEFGVAFEGGRGETAAGVGEGEGGLVGSGLMDAGDGKGAALGHGLDGVVDEVVEDLQEPALIGFDDEVGGEVKIDGDLGMLRLGSVGLQRLLEKGLEVDCGFDGWVGFAEKEPLVDEVADAVGFGIDEVGSGEVGIEGRELGVHFDGTDGVLNFVGEGGGHATEDREFFGLFPLLALVFEGLVGAEKSAGEVADFVVTGCFWEMEGIGGFDGRELAGEVLKWSDQPAGDEPGEQKGDAPEGGEDGIGAGLHDGSPGGEGGSGDEKIVTGWKGNGDGLHAAAAVTIGVCGDGCKVGCAGQPQWLGNEVAIGAKVDLDAEHFGKLARHAVGGGQIHATEEAGVGAGEFFELGTVFSGEVPAHPDNEGDGASEDEGEEGQADAPWQPWEWHEGVLGAG